jgi:pimeloyl-ACP methyl ester carboxylesterase
MSQNEKEVIQSFLEDSHEERLRSILDEEKFTVLQAYLGHDAYQEYKVIANRIVPKLDDNHLDLNTSKNLIFIPGVMGSLLTSKSLGGVWWINALDTARINQLKLSPSGEVDDNLNYQVAPFTTDNSYIGFNSAVIEQDDFGLELFSYDWRKPINLSTNLLKDKILELYEKNGNQPIHLVAHSMGGLIIRATLMNHGNERDDKDRNLWSKIGRIVFIATPHYGSPKIASYLKNHLWGFETLALLGFFLSRETFRSMWGVLSLLPAPKGIYPGTRENELKWASTDSTDPYVHPCVNFDMYKVENWKLDITEAQTSELQRVLNGVLGFHQQMYESHMGLDQELRNRMAVIAGVGYNTLSRMAYKQGLSKLWGDMNKNTNRMEGDPHQDGDGSVPLASAQLEHVGAFRFIKGTHSALPNIPEVYEDVFRWLRGDLMQLPKTPHGALSSHLAAGSQTSQTPNLDDTIKSNSETDDPGTLQFEQSEKDLEGLKVKLEAGQLPEFNRVRLL